MCSGIYEQAVVYVNMSVQFVCACTVYASLYSLSVFDRSSARWVLQQ